MRTSPLDVRKKIEVRTFAKYTPLKAPFLGRVFLTIFKKCEHLFDIKSQTEMYALLVYFAVFVQSPVFRDFATFMLKIFLYKKCVHLLHRFHTMNAYSYLTLFITIL